MLQLSKATIYELIKKGEIIAKKIGKVYRIPTNSISFFFTGLDYDLYKAQSEDLKIISKLDREIASVRKTIK